MSTMEIIPPALLDAEDLGWLKHATTGCFAGVGPGVILPQVVQGNAQLWRFCGERGRGVVVTQMRDYPGGRELYIWQLGGKGVLREIDYIYGVLLDFAKQNYCVWIRGLATPGLARVYERKLGFKRRNIEVIIEV